MIKFSKTKIIKIAFRLLTLYLVLCWVALACFGLYYMYNKRYVYPLKYKEIVCEYADYYGLDRALIFAVIKTESSFNPNAKSKKGAIGLMQITKKTGDYIAQKLGVEKYNLLDSNDNINFGCYYIKYLYARFKDMDTALVAYNAGEGNVSLWLMDKNLSSDGKTLESIPYKESREYIKKIHKNFEKYKKLYKKILDKY